MVRPYNEYNTETGTVRVFDENSEPSELVWHRDKTDREISVINDSDWKIQMDNNIPIKMNHDFNIFIPKETYHRVIKGTTSLVVEIRECNKENDNG